LATQTATQDDVKRIQGGLSEAQTLAARQAAQESITSELLKPASHLSGLVGITEDDLASFLGINKTAASKALRLSNTAAANQVFVERFGEDFKEYVNIGQILDGEQFKIAAKREIAREEEGTLIGYFKKARSFDLPVLPPGLNDILDRYFEAQEAGKINARAERERTERIRTVTEKLAAAKRESLRDAQGRADAKAAAIRDKSLEAERLRRNMQVARF